MYPKVSSPVKVVDFIIPEPWFKMYPEISVPMNVVGLYHPRTSVQNGSDDFSTRERVLIP